MAWKLIAEAPPEDNDIGFFMRVSYSVIYAEVSYKYTLTEPMIHSFCRGQWTPLINFKWWMPAPDTPEGPREIKLR